MRSLNQGDERCLCGGVWSEVVLCAEGGIVWYECRGGVVWYECRGGDVSTHVHHYADGSTTTV